MLNRGRVKGVRQELYVVGLERMSLVPVLSVSFAALLLAVFIGGYKLCNSRESLGECRNLVAQVDQQVPGLDSIVAATDRNRRQLSIFGAGEQVVWHKTTIAKRPEQFIHASGIGVVAGVDVHGVLQAIGLLRQPAGEGLA